MIGEVVPRVNPLPTSTGTGSVRGPELGRDAFMRLLVTQMRFQNPLEPMENREFIAQLSQFSSLEQLTGLRQTLDDSLSMQRDLTQTMSVGLLGRKVEANDNRVTVQSGETPILRYALPQEAQVRIEIQDVQGAVVRSLTPGAQPPGDQEVIWNGLDDRGNPLPEGNYTYHVLAVDGGGRQVPVRPYFTGIVDGVRLSGQGVVLSIGGQEIPLSQVNVIQQTGAERPDS